MDSHDQPTIRIIMLASSMGALASYSWLLADLPVAVETVPSLPGLLEALETVPCQGLIMDVPTLVKGSAEDLARLSEATAVFPSLRLRLDETSGGIMAMFGGQPLAPDTAMERFLAACLRRPPRTMRSAPRASLHLPALLFREPSCPSEAGERAVSLDVTAKGVFLVTFGHWEGTLQAWAMIRAIKDPSPIGLRIKRTAPWGTPDVLPGIGADFTDIKAGQLAELLTLAREQQAWPTTLEQI